MNTNSNGTRRKQLACCIAHTIEAQMGSCIKEANHNQQQFNASPKSQHFQRRGIWKSCFPILLLSPYTGTMDVRVGVLVLFVLGASWASDARQLANLNLEAIKIDPHMQEVETQTVKEAFGGEAVVGNDNVCTMCEEFAGQALNYIGENKTQTEIIGYLHQTCSQLHSFKQQCVTLVDYYAPLFFLEVSSLQPSEFCRKVNLCQQVSLFSSQLQEDSCGLCQRAVSEVLEKLKDPDTQLEIIELLLKACNSVENYTKKCKRLVFEYGPLILANAEQFLETTDICTTLHACNSNNSSTVEASSMAKVSLLSDS